MNTADIIQFNTIQKKLYQTQTGIEVDIQNIGHNTQLLAVREKEEVKTIAPGAWYKKGSIDFPDGNFSNIYDFFWKPDSVDFSPFIKTSDTPYYLYDQMNEDSSILALICGSFFFLTDEADRTPKYLPYNFCVRNNHVISLPISDDPILYSQGGVLRMTVKQATGTIQIGDNVITWCGERSSLRSTVSHLPVLYNSRSSEVIKIRDPKTGLQIGILDDKNITTPIKNGIVDVIFNLNAKGELYISEIRKKGGSHFFDGHIILQMPEAHMNLQVGQIAQPLTLDSLPLKGITDAITTGKSVHDPFFLEEIRVNRRDSRSLIAKDKEGNIHFIIFDGSKYIPGFKGVSAKEIASYFSKEKYEWAYFLDGGGSARLIVRDGNTFHYLANRFLVKKMSDGSFLWDWEKGRSLASSVALKRK